MAELSFLESRPAPDVPGVPQCCRTQGALTWSQMADDSGIPKKGKYVGVCKTCGRRHFVLRVKEAESCP